MFKLEKKSKKSKARLGVLETKNGEIHSPFFMPIATKASVKGLTSNEMRGLGAEILLANTYHLWLRPGDDVIKQAGGLGKYMLWDGPILTDSGGYQVFSLSKMRKVKDEGVEFQSHLDGKKLLLTPEKALEIQQNIGSDIAMVLDVCSPYPCSRRQADEDLEITLDWAKRTRKFLSKNLSSFKSQEGNKKRVFPQVFGIVQGGTYKDLRLRSIAELLKLDFDGYAFGGLAVGEPASEMYEILDYIVPILPEDKPRYLMGAGYPEQIVEAVKRGIDMFDCVIPTRNARHGSLFVRTSDKLERKFYKIVHIKNEEFKENFEVLDQSCDCDVCKTGYSKSYLRHLLLCKEPLFIRLATLHNLRFYLRLMKDVQSEIENE